MRGWLRQGRACFTLAGIALVKPLQIVVEFGVRQFDKLRKGYSSDVAVLVVDCLDPGAVDGEQFATEQFQQAPRQHELAEGVAVVRAGNRQ